MRTPDWQTDNGRCHLYLGECHAVLRNMPERSVQCCVTSPPYWGLRDYGHSDQLGLEPTPELYVERMVEVFREVRRVLRDDGVAWINLGDSYFGGGYSNHDINGDSWKERMNGDKRASRQQDIKRNNPSIKPKDLVGIPWRVAFALQADGWYLRQDIIWHKPNPMPESVTDRCTKAHEYVFLLSKSARYFYDAEAVKEVASRSGEISGGGHKASSTGYLPPNSSKQNMDKFGAKPISDNRNRRSVWTVSTKPYSGAHFATYPPELIEPCILAGTSDRGACRECGAAWERTLERIQQKQYEYEAIGIPGESSQRGRRTESCGTSSYTSIGWQPACNCNSGEPIPCVVLDPFNGSGTTGQVCIQHGRAYRGIELNPEYLELAKRRLLRAVRRHGTPLFD